MLMLLILFCFTDVFLQYVIYHLIVTLKYFIFVYMSVSLCVYVGEGACGGQKKVSELLPAVIGSCEHLTWQSLHPSEEQ